MSEQSQKSSNMALILIAGLIFVGVVAFGIYLVLGEVIEDDEPTTLQTVDSVGEVLNQELTNFTFVDNTGNELSLADLSGNYVLLSFGYTSCPDVCPATMLEFRRVKSMLGDETENVKFVFISVDEGRDTPDVLDRYMKRFDPEFIGLQGDDAELQQIKDEYGLIYEIGQNDNTQAGYLVTHTASKYLINPEGKLIRVYSFTTDASDIAAEVASLDS